MWCDSMRYDTMRFNLIWLIVLYDVIWCDVLHCWSSSVPHQQNSVSIKNTISTVNSDLKNKYYAKSNENNNCQTQTQNQLILNDSAVAAAAPGPRQLSYSVFQSNSIQYNTINANNNSNNSSNNINNGINNTKRPLSHYSDPYTAYTPLPSTPPLSEHKGIKHFGSIKSEWNIVCIENGFNLWIILNNPDIELININDNLLEQCWTASNANIAHIFTEI